MKKYKVFFEWEFQTLVFFLENASNYFLNSYNNTQTDIFVSSDGKMSDYELSIASLMLTFESTINKLNIIVDFALLCFVNNISNFHEDTFDILEIQKQLKASRSTLLNTLKHDGIYYDKLPGWNHVINVRDDSNAIKHRGGIHVPVESLYNIPISKNVDLRKEKITDYINGIKTWLFNLIDEIERNSMNKDNTKDSEQ